MTAKFDSVLHKYIDAADEARDFIEKVFKPTVGRLELKDGGYELYLQICALICPDSRDRLPALTFGDDLESAKYMRAEAIEYARALMA
jgi:hypothetical protein